jgi:hypothetical protein
MHHCVDNCCIGTREEGTGHMTVTGLLDEHMVFTRRSCTMGISGGFIHQSPSLLLFSIGQGATYRQLIPQHPQLHHLLLGWMLGKSAPMACHVAFLPMM